MRQLLPRSANLIEDVVVSLAPGLEDDPGLLQEIGSHGSSNDVEVTAEVDLDELAEAGAVVIPSSLCVSDGLNINIFHYYSVYRTITYKYPTHHFNEFLYTKTTLLTVLNMVIYLFTERWQ